MIEFLRVLKACRKTAVATRRVALQMIHNTIVAPRRTRGAAQHNSHAAHPVAGCLPAGSDRLPPRGVGRQDHAQVAGPALPRTARRDRRPRCHDHRHRRRTRARSHRPELDGHGSAAQLLLTAGDNAARLQSEASFAALCGVSPVPASSGKTTRHRLNRGGDRAANSWTAIWRRGNYSNPH